MYDCPAFPGVHQYASLVTGASIQAANCLLSGSADVAIHWTGGWHHAKRLFAYGCVVYRHCIQMHGVICMTFKAYYRLWLTHNPKPQSLKIKHINEQMLNKYHIMMFYVQRRLINYLYFYSNNYSNLSKLGLVRCSLSHSLQKSNWLHQIQMVFSVCDLITYRHIKLP